MELLMVIIFFLIPIVILFTLIKLIFKNDKNRTKNIIRAIVIVFILVAYIQSFIYQSFTVRSNIILLLLTATIVTSFRLDKKRNRT